MEGEATVNAEVGLFLTLTVTTSVTVQLAVFPVTVYVVVVAGVATTLAAVDELRVPAGAQV